VQRRLVDLQAVFPKHVQERSFPRVIKTEEEDFGVLVVEA
jgi:hypothetical protein